MRNPREGEGYRALAAMALALLVAACAHAGGERQVRPASPPTIAALPGLSPAQRVEEAIQRLRQGHKDQARVELRAALDSEPGNPWARRLLAQIDTDPKALLGSRRYAYKVKPGETLWGLSQRFLGDPLLFYALARYNGIAVPENMEGGRTLLIPGVPKKAPAPPVRRPSIAKAAPPAPPPVQARPVDPAQASRLRRTALEHMNRGHIDQAEVLLQQAQALDPENVVIQADLDRARRIQASVRPRS